MDRLTFLKKLLSQKLILSDKTKRPAMSIRLKDANYKECARVPAAVDASQLDRFLILCYVEARDTARALNTVSRRPRPSQKLQWPCPIGLCPRIICGDDPIDSDCKCTYKPIHIIIKFATEEEVEEQLLNFNGNNTHTQLNYYY